MHALKAAKFLDWPRDGAHELMHIELRHFVSFAVAGVCHVQAHGCGLARRNLGRFDAQIVETERGVAEAKAERKEWLARRENIRAIARRLVIVESGKLAHRPRKSDRQ